MYSGTTLTKYSGRLLGAHQKFDRTARFHLARLIGESTFPSKQHILQFEGKNGPDGIKRKSPAKDEPWHYLDPFDPADDQLLGIIRQHYKLLKQELKKNNQEKSAFEAAWLAHGIVDGLTPAHHYPYEQKLVELRGGKPIETRTTIKEKLIMHGETPLEQVKNNWKMWGPKGLITTHGFFEIGIAAILAPAQMNEAFPSKSECESVLQHGFEKYFINTAREIAVLDMYTRFYEHGWTPKLAYDIRHKLGPKITKCITLAWYNAAVDAQIHNPTNTNYRRRLQRKTTS